jgi:Spy/CpxP family protein refolding chaperone
MNWKRIAIAAAIASSIAGAGVYAQQTQPPAQGMRPGMMTDRSGPGYGPGARGYPGYGMGQGMMGQGWGVGPGMMGGYGRGWGMGPGMGGYGSGWGMGSGMMDGPGMGMMGDFGLDAVSQLDLNDNQRKQVLRVEDELRKKNWELVGKMHDEMSKLRDAMWVGDKRDQAGILAANKRMSELRQQMLENSLVAADKVEAALTPQQREQLKRLGR